MGKTFFEYVMFRRYGKKFRASSLSAVTGDTSLYAFEYLLKTVSSFEKEGSKITFRLVRDFPSDVINEAKDAFSEDEEAYALRVSEDEVTVFGKSDRALIFGVSTVRQLFSSGEFETCFLFDYPDKHVRGYRVFTPGEAQFDTFFKMVDYLVLYKFNAIIIEVGGAMQYERHPEINAKWTEFCTEMHKSPCETDRVQHKLYPSWTKNAIHADNGDGGFITKKQMKDLVDYCKRRGLEVIPEIPSLSHSDYIVMAHPELNERKEDAYPDTYCPSNPDTYRLLFDLMDEILDVFRPRFVHIGHDEVYTLGKCERCRGKDPVDLYVGDIRTISEHLSEIGIRTIMWCEKTYEVWQSDGWPIGGAGNDAVDIPRLADCAEKIPKDVIYLDWYWGAVGPDYQQRNVDLGHSMLYGNVNPCKISQYRKRPKEIDGGFASNWGSFEAEYMQRNAQNTDLLATAYVFWSHTYDDSEYSTVLEKVCDQLYLDYCRSLGKDRIGILHTTSLDIQTKPFYDGYYIVDEDWIIGNYRIRYEDGSEILLPVKYGYNIKCENTSFSFGTPFASVVGATRPILRNGKTLYLTSYKDPYPGKKIVSLTYEKIKEADVLTVSWQKEND